MDSNDNDEFLETEQLKKIGIATLDDTFNNNKDNKLYKIRDKSYAIAQKLKNLSKSEIDIAKQNIYKIQKEFALQYPSLFNSSPFLIYCHVDLDSFYASCESLDHPEYKSIPLAVGSMNMLTTSNYVARKYGVKAGMPGYIGKQLCPTLKIVKCDFAKYNYYSERVMSVLSIFDEDIEIYGVDEACLVFDDSKYKKAVMKLNDIGYNISVLNQEASKVRVSPKIVGFDQHYSSTNNSYKIFTPQNDSIYTPITDTKFSFRNIRKLVDNIRTLVFISTGLTISSGISVTRGLSKYACGINKPNGSFVIDKNFDSHILDLETDKINGIGLATKELLLKAYNIKYIKELRDNLHFIYLTLPYKSFINLFNLSYGLSVFDFSDRSNKPVKSIGMNTSFRPTTDFSDICTVLWCLCTSLCTKLKSKSLVCSTITLHYKFSSFSSRTKQSKTSKLIDDPVQLFNICYDLLLASKVILDTKIVPNKIRLLGVSCSLLTSVNKKGMYSFTSTVYNFKVCPICKKESIHLNNFMFECHVNSCLNSKEKENAKLKNTLDFYVKKT